MSERRIVIGAGIVGAGIAWHLARRGAEVAVLEQAAPAGGASGSSFGWINANFTRSPAYFNLRCAAMAEYRALARAGGLDIDLQRLGGLWWELTGRDFDRRHRELAACGYPVDRIDAAQFAALEPAIAEPPARCLYTRMESAVDAQTCTETLLRAAVRHGAALRPNCRVTGFVTDRGKVAGVKTAGGVMRAGTVVVAAGTQTQPLLAQAGVRLPMDNRAGIIIRTRPLEAVVRHIVFAPDIHFRQQSDGVIVAGETFGGDAPGGGLSDDPAALASEILRRLRRKLPRAGTLAIDRVTSARRPMPADGLPAVGAPDGINGLYIACMHSGVTLAPLIGKLAALEILEGKPAELLAPFRPSRFA